MCTNCHTANHTLWAVGPPYPKFCSVSEGNFVFLQGCTECGQLWLESMYEPFASFRYAVKWPWTRQKFEEARDQDQSLTLCKWHEAEVRLQGAKADAETLAHIQAHYKRAGGYVDLTPTGEPNPIAL
jgi:hypothetical protein